MNRRAIAAAAVAVVLLAGVTACGEDPANAPDPDTRTADPDRQPSDGPTSGSGPAYSAPVEASDVVTGLTSPWGLVVFSDGSALVSERDTGDIVLLPAGDPGAAEVVGSVPEAEPDGEAGLLGLATSPEEDRVLVYYSTANDNRIVSMSWDGATLGEPQLIFDGIPGGAGYHQGGRLAVGPDDLLYVSTGDNGEPDLAQDRTSLAGKILRLTLEGEPAPDNPFGTAVFSYGHRNVQGLAFDDEQRLWASEFGSDEFDELNLIEAGSNYGWPLVEGSGENSDFVNPKAVWRTEDASPSGLAYWQGSLWMAALRGERLWEIPVDGTEVADPVGRLAGEYGRLRTVVTLPDDSGLWVATSNTDGRGEVRDGDDRVLRVSR